MKKIALSALSAALLLVAAATATATANGPPQIETAGPFTSTAVNPCTGELHEVTTFFTIRIHEFELADPARHHLNLVEEGTISTSDGFTGRLTNTLVLNTAGLEGEEEGGTATATTSGIARDASGQAFRVRALSHITVVDDEVVVEMDVFELRCLT